MKNKMMQVLLSLSAVFLLGVFVAAHAKPIQTDQMKPAETMQPSKAKKSKAKKPKAKKAGGAMSMTGVPKGVQACLDHLIKMAEKEPLMEYEGHPSEIINGGLMWPQICCAPKISQSAALLRMWDTLPNPPSDEPLKPATANLHCNGGGLSKIR